MALPVQRNDACSIDRGRPRRSLRRADDSIARLNTHPHPLPLISSPTPTYPSTTPPSLIHYDSTPAGDKHDDPASTSGKECLVSDPSEFFDALDTLDVVDDHTPRPSFNGSPTKVSGVVENGGIDANGVSPHGEGTSPAVEFTSLSPQEQVASVVAEGGVPYKLCEKAWEQRFHVDRVGELLAATKERVAREKGVDRKAAMAKKASELENAPEPPEMSLYDQAKGVIGRMQLGQDITRFELPANFLTPFSAVQAAEDILTIICGTKRELSDWNALSDPKLDAMERFLNVLRVYIDMESIRADEGTSGGSKSSFTLPPMKKPINSVLGETHRLRVDDVEMVMEQVSHHPPITCYEMEHEKVGLKITGNLSPKPIFHGTSVQVALRGTLLFELKNTGEVYTASLPDLYICFFGLNGGYNETVGKVRFERVSAGNTGDNRRMWADLHFKARGSAGWKSKANRIDGTVYEAEGLKAGGGGGGKGVLRGSGSGGGMGFGFLENFGAVDANTRSMAAKWCAKAGVGGNSRVVMTLKGHYNTEIRANGNELFWQSCKRREQFPMAATVPIDLETESHLVWGDLVRAIVAEDWKKAGIAKRRVESAQRSLMKEINEGRKVWEPRLFKQGQKEDLGVVNGMYTLKPFVRIKPPGPDPDWHEHITKNVFLDI